MAILPRSIAGKCIATIWSGLCIAVLIFGYEQQHIHDMPIAFVWFMLFLTAPAGILVSALVAISAPFLDSMPGHVYHPFWDLVPFWIGCALLGYAQWFVMIPWLWRKVFRGKAI